MYSPFALIIFGGTGDLALHKLFPALFSLFTQGLLSETFSITGFSRRAFSDEEYRDFIRSSLTSEQDELLNSFLQHVYYQQGLFDEKDGYEQLIPRLNQIDSHVVGCITRVFYLATPPDNYENILNYLKDTKLSEGCGQGTNQWTRIAIEKPFGKDLETAKALDKKLEDVFDEKQIFRVDHYLGKDSMQNLLTFRFANGIFEPVWNRGFIDHVQITASETVDISNRGRFYDGVGHLRDWGQNHLLQIAAALAMEQPRSFTREGVRDVRASALKSIRPVKPEQISDMFVRGQYEGYRQTPDVDPDSLTETFVAFKMFFDTPRFFNVPFYLRSGKNMAEHRIEISIVFVQTCHVLFKEYGCPEIGNVLRIRLNEPKEGINFTVIAKKPGATFGLDTIDLSFTYKDHFGTGASDAYQKLLLDIFTGDQMLFNRSDELESTWEYITSILDGWKLENQNGHRNIYGYAPGSWGPKESDDLMAKDGKTWL
jgi:glucose-6-phosphate 1-dehydrogenase